MAQTLLILVALGCFDSYKFDYSKEFAFVFRSNEKSAPVLAGWLRTRGVRIHSFRDLIKAKTRPPSARMEFWRGTRPHDLPSSFSVKTEKPIRRCCSEMLLAPSISARSLSIG